MKKIFIRKDKIFSGDEKLPRNYSSLKKILRIMIYILLLIIFLKGVGSILSNDTVRLNSLVGKIENFLDNPPEQLIDDLALQGKAKEVIHEYLTFNGNKEERNKRINALIFNKVDETFEGDIKAISPIDIQVLGVEGIKENEACVTLQASYRIKREKLKDEEKILSEEIQKSFYKVTVVRDSFGVKVKDIPLLIPVKEPAQDFDRKNVKYPSVEVEQKREVDESLRSFYKAYYEGTPKDISYLTTIKELKGLGAQAKFLNLRKTDARMGDDGRVFVVSEIKVKDNLKTYDQKYELVLIKIEDKYLVESIDLMNKAFVKHYEEDIENE